MFGQLQEWEQIFEDGWTWIQPVSGAVAFMAATYTVNQIFKWVRTIIGIDKSDEEKKGGTDYQSVG